MKQYNGVGVGHGLVRGRIMNYSPREGRPETREISDIKSEQSRFRLARYIAVKELALLYEKAYAEFGESAAMIFYIHQVMLDDDTFTDMVCSLIETKRINAESAVYDACIELSKMFNGLDDGYMRERKADVSDISERVIAILQNESRSFPILKEPSVIICQDLSPSELLLPERGLVQGVILLKGSTASHTAILAEKMKIPMIVSVDLEGEMLADGTTVTVDADKGFVMVEQ